jgi:hypothetical protein
MICILLFGCSALEKRSNKAIAVQNEKGEYVEGTQ